jgi:hypothetical protein
MLDCRVRILFAVSWTLACLESSDSPAEMEFAVADYCDRVCNCADIATDECVAQCSGEFKAEGNTLGQDCLSCVDTTACDVISTDCHDVCGGLVSDFPDAGSPELPDGGVPGCSTGRLDAGAFYVLIFQNTCSTLVACDLESDIDACVADALSRWIDLDLAVYECDPGPAWDCLEEAAAATCEMLTKNDDVFLYNLPICQSADNTCCDTQAQPSEGGKDGGSGKRGRGRS